ncbi:MAG: ethanolamine ammonia-lyase subunit EutC [Yoonia sp.]|uniref:ethanolamine ammonia-lyase subunit EutC n=1 Tax=Yoonia sp. TaxID=2212373 RepID=UPI003EF131F2
MSDDLTPRAAIRAMTQARLSFGPPLRAADTKTTLAFALDHARAREAVTSDLDIERIGVALADAGLEHDRVTSAATTRDAFITRPDLGRQLPQDHADRLARHPSPDVAIVLGDGLSAVAVALNGAAFVTQLAEHLAQAGLTCGPVILARQARVALGDRIARAIGATTVVMIVGERPGLSAADGLGIYITQAPLAKTPDSARNCISNVRAEGLPIPDAARQTYGLIKEMRAIGLSGVALTQSRASGALTQD